MSTTYVVDPSGGGTHLTVQSAIEDAVRGTVFVRPGLYTETLTVPKHVHLRTHEDWEKRRRKQDRIVWRARLKRRPRYIAKGGIRK